MRKEPMDESLEVIVSKMRKLGACNKLDDIHTWKNITDAFFTAYGVEFMQKKSFPSMYYFKKHKDRLAVRHIFVDAGEFSAANVANLGVIGKTTVNVKYSGVESLNTVVVMNGATANIVASNYAVIKVYNLEGIVNIKKDKTVKIL